MRALWIALALAALPAAGCTNDCTRLCQKQNECLGEPSEDALTLCSERCERDVEDDAIADEVSRCLGCFEKHGCDELLPVEEGACADDCRGAGPF